MAIHVKKGDLKVVSGAKPLQSVLIGPKRVYGDDLSKYELEYPALPEGANYFIKLNGSKIISNPAEAGTSIVHYGDNITIRVYGKEGYANPSSTVLNRSVSESGQIYSIAVANESIPRATTYSYVVKGNGKLTVQPALQAPKIRININKDEGVDNVSFTYSKSPYDIAFDYDSNLSTEAYTVNTLDSYRELSYASNILSVVGTTAKEGYKTDGIDSNYFGILTRNDQCTITANSIKGKKINLTCPALADGIAEYNLSLISSEFSRNQSRAVFYDGTETVASMNSRIYGTNAYYFYENDIIQIAATREEGYKLPTLGIQGDVTDLILKKEITLINDSSLVVMPGEAGIRIVLENAALSTGEYVLINVESEFNNGNNSEKNPPIYVGDRISIPLSPHYRIGTLANRKPGVGLSDGVNTIQNITFSSSVNYTVPSSISKLQILLEQGAARIESASFNAKSRILDMRDEGRYISKQWGQCGIDDDIVPVAGLGEEGFFLKSLKLIYYTKRYLGDIIGDKFYKHIIENLEPDFSCSCVSNLGITYRGVLEGNYEISEDKTFVSMNITEYKKTWVANTTHGVYLFAQKIII